MASQRKKNVSKNKRERIKKDKEQSVMKGIEEPKPKKRELFFITKIKKHGPFIIKDGKGPLHAWNFDIIPFNLLKAIVKWLIKKVLDIPTQYNSLLDVCVIVFISIYTLFTIGWIHFYSIQAEFNYFNWKSYVSIMLLTAAIHVWVYAFLKNLKSIKKLNTLFPDSYDYNTYILPKLKNLVWPCPWTKGCNTIEIFVKCVFLALWVGCSVKIVHACDNLNLFNMGSDLHNIYGVIIRVYPRVIMMIGMFLNYFSYYSSIVFCYFTRMISNADDIECDGRVPWNSEKLRDLVHISSRTSMSFLAVSMLYLLAVVVYTCPVGDLIRGLNDVHKEALMKNEVALLVALSVFLCGVSFIIISFLPKIFMNRLFREWKIAKVGDLRDDEEKNGNNNDEAIKSIWESSLPYVKMEIASAFMTFAIDFSALIVAIIDLKG